MKKNYGFTLVELLIAMSLLSMIMLLGSTAFSIFSDKWNRTRNHFNHSLELVRASHAIQTVIDGIVPLVVEDGQKAGFYFIGRKNSIRAVSLNGLVTNDSPVVFELSVGKVATGEKVLIYKETATRQLMLKSLSQKITFSTSIPLLHNIDDLEFSFKGWAGFEEKSQVKINYGNPIEHIRYYNNYLGDQRKLMPEEVVVKYSRDGSNVEHSSKLSGNSEFILGRYIDEK